MITDKVEMFVGDKSGGVCTISKIITDPESAKALMVDVMMMSIAVGNTVTFKPVYEDGKDK